MKILSAEDASGEDSGRRERAKTANRNAILTAARRTFAELGYDAATVRDIIRRTDLASGTFYNYYRSKEEVFEALADDTAHRFRPILRAARDRAKTWEEFLHIAFRAYFQFLSDENPEAASPPLQRRPHVRNDTPEVMAIYGEVREGIEDAIARGLAPRLDSEYLAHACIGIAQEVGDAMLARRPRDVAGAAAFAATLILNGVAGAPRGA